MCQAHWSKTRDYNDKCLNKSQSMCMSCGTLMFSQLAYLSLGEDIPILSICFTLFSVFKITNFKYF